MPRRGRASCSMAGHIFISIHVLQTEDDSKQCMKENTRRPPCPRAYKNTRPHGFALPCGPVGVLGVLLGPPFISIHVPQTEDDVREYMKEDYNEQWVQNGSPPFHTSIIRWFLRFAVSFFSQSLRGGYAPEISSNAPVSRVSSTSSMASIAACIASPRSEA